MFSGICIFGMMYMYVVSMGYVVYNCIGFMSCFFYCVVWIIGVNKYWLCDVSVMFMVGVYGNGL